MWISEHEKREDMSAGGSRMSDGMLDERGNGWKGGNGR